MVLKIFQTSGRVGETAKKINLEIKSFRSLIIYGTHAANDLHISFDGGNEWLTDDGAVLYGFGENVLLEKPIQVKASGADTTWEMVIVYDPAI